MSQPSSTRPSRAASQQAMAKTQAMFNDDCDDLIVIDDKPTNFVEKKKNSSNDDKPVDNASDEHIVPIVTQNSKKYDLNYFKQF